MRRRALRTSGGRRGRWRPDPRPGTPSGAAFAVLAGLALVLATVTACSGPHPRSLLESIDSGSVLIGTRFDQPGLSVRAGDGSMQGFDVAVAQYVVRRIAADRGRPDPRIAWRDTPTAVREQLIENGEVDAIVSAYSIDAQRARRVTFAGPYLVTRQALLVRSGDRTVTGLADLGRGRTLCSVSGSTPARAVKAQLPGVRLREFDSTADCVDQLRRGYVDALTTDEAILAGFARRSPGDLRVLDMNLPADACIDGVVHPAGSPFAVERYGIGLGHGDDAARDAVNAALREMIASGEWGRALRRALGDPDVDRMIARAGGVASFRPEVGDLGFLTDRGADCRAY